MSFFLNIHGSASEHCDAGRLARAHAFVDAAVGEVLEGGGGVVAFVSGEVLHGSGLPCTFDWSVVQRAHDYCVAQGITEERLRVVTFASSPDRRFPVSRQQLFDSLTRSAFARVDSLDERVRGGDQYRKRVADLSDAVIAISGGRGVAKLHHEHGNRLTTLPMDLDLGAFLGEHDGRGALDLRDAALTGPDGFFRFAPQRLATRLRAIAIAPEASDPAAVAREAVALIREDLAARDRGRALTRPSRENQMPDIQTPKQQLEIERIRPWLTLNERDFLVTTEQLREPELRQIRQLVEWYGIALIRIHGQAADTAVVEALARSFGSPTETQNDFEGGLKDIRPTQKVTTANTGDSARELGPHVDGTQHDRQPDLLIFQYVRGPDYGGHSTFWDLAQVFHELSTDKLNQLVSALAHPTAGLFEKKGMRYEGPLVRLNAHNGLVLRERFDEVIKLHPDVQPWHDYLSTRLKQRALEFTPVRGDIVIFDNGRLLHGRGPIGGEDVRHHRRMWIESLHPELHSEIKLGVRPIPVSALAEIQRLGTSMVARGGLM